MQGSDGAPRAVCSVPTCIAYATKNGLCPVHASPSPPLPTELERFVAEDTAVLRQRRPHLQRYLLGVHVVPLPVPSLLDFQFNSPYGTVLVSRDLEPQKSTLVLVRNFIRLSRQVRRYRRREHVGVCEPLHIGGCPDRYVAWKYVEPALQRADLRLPNDARAALERQAGPCPQCRVHPSHLRWTYLMAPSHAWLQGSAFAGWLAVCLPCREQVALFIDRQN